MKIIKSLTLSVCLCCQFFLPQGKAIAQPAYERTSTNGSATPAVPRFSIEQLDKNTIYHFSLNVSTASIPVDVNIDAASRERIMATGFRGIFGDPAVILYAVDLLGRHATQSSLSLHVSQPIVVQMTSLDQPPNNCIAIRICIWVFGNELCLLDWSHCF